MPRNFPEGNLLICTYHGLEGAKRNFVYDYFKHSFSKKVKGAPSDLRQFLTAESPLKLMTNTFYFTSKALFDLKIFKFLS